MKKILILGATSAIAEATARLWAKEGHRLYLIARNAERLQGMAADLKIRGAESAHIGVLDLNDFELHEAALDEAIRTLEGVDIALIAHGTLGDQKSCEKDFILALRELNTNALSAISLLTHLANRLESQSRGCLAVISSVAGDRGRQSNYVYGTAKGALTVFAQGLRQRLHKSGVQVLTVKPGFVDTPMTRKFKKGILWAKPERVASSIDAGIRKKRNVIYAPSFWFWVMLIIRSVPETIFKKMNL